jgi:predicted ATPase
MRQSRSPFQTGVKPYLKSITIDHPDEQCEQFPFTIPALRDLDRLEFHPDVTFIVGENGSGKSTLIEAVATVMGLGAEGGTGNHSMKDQYGSSSLADHLRPQRNIQKPKDKYFLRAESFYNIGNYLEELAEDPDANAVEDRWGRTPRERAFARYGGKSLHLSSHGESFLTVITQTFAGNGLYIMDEPEAALSPSRQLAALIRINDLVSQNSQFIIATHSPILLSYPRSRIYLLNERGCNEVSYEDTEHYQITRDFLNNYPKRLEALFSENGTVPN